MNEQSSKKILFNKSTLFSLKAELLRKQEEVKEKKQLPQHKVENFKPPPTKSSKKEKPIIDHKKTFKDSLKAVDTEEIEACRKAKKILEKKAELYEHLSDSSGNSELAGRFLVDFDSKKQQDTPVEISDYPEPPEEHFSERTEFTNDVDEWTEYTDCLGRTRKCLKSDVEMYIRRDKDLLKAMTGTVEEESIENEISENKTEKPLLVQKTNDYLRSLREKWEEKEKELLAKDRDIHYQDLLFDEARMHGVGYYSFSMDESERRNQMEELMKRREETLLAQKQAEQVRKKRDELMAARVAAARARQRARAGLPPEDPQEKREEFTQRLLQFLNEQKNEVDAKAREEEKRIKEEHEKERQKLREAYIREWDLGKEGIDDKVKKFKEMTQEEYVEQQRDKRIDEFAPPQATGSQNDQYFDERGKLVSFEIKNKTWDDVRPKTKTPPPPEIGDLTAMNEQKGLYFSTSNKQNIKYKNFVKSQEPTPILNELDDDFEDHRSNIDKRKHDSSNIEIEPPPTYEYYGPVPKQIRSEKPFYSDLREAYSQGAKSLESKSSNRQLSNKYDFMFD
ncbi:hypothetical protein K1T71_012233 [Dendrolimus kikuchii]|uniref:Uncharacterized protein n=1 Tax=Dendrolimus kikuchii TaxID=765133 RepID=A0ACC1CL09_9NEOP|nr:hypothetical protein K1T71_012233 [Dendrolimus kikuchii]